MQIDLILGVVAFSGIVLALVGVIIGARSQLVSTGDVSIEINGDSDNPLVVPAGSKLLQTLADNNKAKEILGWNPKGNLERWLKSYLDRHFGKLLSL